MKQSSGYRSSSRPVISTGVCCKVNEDSFGDKGPHELASLVPDAREYALDTLDLYTKEKEQIYGPKLTDLGIEAESWILSLEHGAWSYEEGQFIISQLSEQTSDTKSYYTACLRFRECIELEMCPKVQESFRSLEDVASLDELVNPEEDCDVPPISPCLKSERHGSTRAFKETSQTLIFLDWDDTLFPTTELFDNWGLPSSYDAWDDISLTEDQEDLLQRWAGALQLYLRSACSVADRCTILTNSSRPWVSKCIERFAPKVYPFFESLQGLKVIYARESLANQRRGSRIYNGLPRGIPVKNVDKEVLEEEKEEKLTKAKFVAMQDEAKAFYSQYPGQTWKNIISIGDAIYEHDAARELAFRRRGSKRERFRVKTIVTPQRPYIRDLTYRLRFARLLFRAYVNFDGEFDINMNSPDQLREIANALGMPELHSCIRQAPMAGDEDEQQLSEELEDIAFIVDDRTARQISELSIEKDCSSRQVSQLSTSSSLHHKAMRHHDLPGTPGTPRKSDEVAGG